MQRLLSLSRLFSHFPHQPLHQVLAASAARRPFSSSIGSTIHTAEAAIHALHADTVAHLARHDYPAALTAAEECAAASEAHFGKKHAATASALNNVAQVHRAAGRPAEAVPHMEAALEVYEEVLGDSHASTATAFANLGQLRMVLALSGKGMERAAALDAAKGLLDAALAARRRAFGARHVQVGVSLYLCASVARLQKRYDAAEGLLREALVLLRAAAGSGGGAGGGGRARCARHSHRAQQPWRAAEGARPIWARRGSLQGGA